MPKSKTNIKVRDLKPSKDAKGGGGGVQRHRRHSIQGTGGATQGTGGATQGTGGATQGGGVSQG